MAKSASRAKGRFKQLCCLGLGGEAVMPALLAELHAVVPSYVNVFHFADEAGNPANFYNQHPGFVDVAPLYAELFYERRDREIKGLSYSEASACQFGVHDAEAAVGPSCEYVLRFSDIFNLIGVPLGYDANFLRLFIRDGKRRRTLGAITLYPSIGARSWTAEEKRRLGDLEPFFAYALTEHGEDADVMTDSGRSGVIIADPEGRPVHLSAEGRRLLFLATHPSVAPGSAVRRVPFLPSAVARICGNLSRASSADAKTSAPVHHHRNIWGSFRFRAEWLDGNDPATGRIAITVTHEEPLRVRLTRAAEGLPLTRRQAEVCVLMASGLSRDQIAERLGISRHTAREHGRWIYHRLNVHNRSELTGKLILAGMNATPTV